MVGERPLALSACGDIAVLAPLSDLYAQATIRTSLTRRQGKKFCLAKTALTLNSILLKLRPVVAMGYPGIESVPTTKAAREASR